MRNLNAKKTGLIYNFILRKTMTNSINFIFEIQIGRIGQHRNTTENNNEYHLITKYNMIYSLFRNL